MLFLSSFFFSFFPLLAAGTFRAASVSVSRTALERALASERGPRGTPVVTHLCASPSPAAIPLPFPRFFAPQVSRDGAIACGSNFPNGRSQESDEKLHGLGPIRGGREGSRIGGRRSLGPDVVSAPVLGRLISPRGGSRLVSEALEVLRSSRRRSPGALSMLSAVSKAAGLEEGELESCIEALESVGGDALGTDDDD